MSEFMDNIGIGLEEGENNELTLLSASELIDTTEEGGLGLAAPINSILEHIMVDCDDFQLLRDE